MEQPQKKVISFYLDDDTIAKLDQLAKAQRRNRSTQIAFLIDEACKTQSVVIPVTIEQPSEAAQ
jgi:predicted transcriptional regulator